MGVTKLKKVCEATIHTWHLKCPYMAPEMFRKARRGPAVDIYSLGALFLELFGCRRVWPGLESAEIMLKVCGSPPEMPDMTHLDSATFHICESCLRVDANHRPNINEIVVMLQDLDTA